MSEEGGRYVSYLLRLWEVQGKDGLVWRASLEQASTGERRGFACLADLFASLEQETALADQDRPHSQRAEPGEKWLVYQGFPCLQRGLKSAKESATIYEAMEAFLIGLFE